MEFLCQFLAGGFGIFFFMGTQEIKKGKFSFFCFFYRGMAFRQMGSVVGSSNERKGDG